MKIVKNKVHLFRKKVEMFSKLLFTKSLNRLEHCTFSEDELQQTMLENPALVYNGIW